MINIFLVNEVNKINSVFSSEMKNKILSGSEDSFTIYTKQDIGKTDFTNVKYIFSTWNMPVLTEQEIKTFFPSLKAIFYAAGTVKYFAKPFLNCGIDIYNADTINSLPVAEFAYAQILLANKGFFQAQLLYRKKRYRMAKKILEKYPGNYNSIVGIVGVGRIGRKVIELLHQNDVRILVNDICLSDSDAKELGVENVSLNEIFTQCDVISNHLPDIPSTKNIFNYELFSQMKEYAVFINTGRGRQVNEQDLARCLKKKKNISAVLDVLEREPLRPNSPLFFRHNVFITPHMAGSIGNEEHRLAEHVYSVYQKYIHEKNPEGKITVEMIENMT